MKVLPPVSDKTCITIDITCQKQDSISHARLWDMPVGYVKKEHPDGLTLVMAAVRVVLPWSTWPMVPMLRCALSRALGSYDAYRTIFLWKTCLHMKVSCEMTGGHLLILSSQSTFRRRTQHCTSRSSTTHLGSYESKAYSLPASVHPWCTTSGDRQASPEREWVQVSTFDFSPKAKILAEIAKVEVESALLSFSDVCLECVN
jgi:hypothetical protein